jgi:hypothetical protein
MWIVTLDIMVAVVCHGCIGDVLSRRAECVSHDWAEHRPVTCNGRLNYCRSEDK